MNNQAIAEVMQAIGLRLKTKNDNPFKIRAHHTASKIISTSAVRITDLSDEELSTTNGITKQFLSTRRFYGLRTEKRASLLRVIGDWRKGHTTRQPS
jgi:DNA polymerase/3'-5' exonuclease PolX